MKGSVPPVHHRQSEVFEHFIFGAITPKLCRPRGIRTLVFVEWQSKFRTPIGHIRRYQIASPEGFEPTILGVDNAIFYQLNYRLILPKPWDSNPFSTVTGWHTNRYTTTSIWRSPWDSNPFFALTTHYTTIVLRKPRRLWWDSNPQPLPRTEAFTPKSFRPSIF